MTTTIKEGDRLPDGKFWVMDANGVTTVSTHELFAGKKIVFFGVPGAFTSTCSRSHLPGFINHAEAILAAGADAIACMSVNDAAVMHAWGLDRGVGDKILMLADGNCDFAKSLGLSIDASAFGSGMRSLRFAMIVDDGAVSWLRVDEPGKFELTRAEDALEALTSGNG